MHLGQEVNNGPLIEEDDGAGNGKVDGNTRKLEMRQVEEMRGTVLKESF